MKTVYLHGKLGKRFGKKWDLNVRSPLEAFSAIEANSEGFLHYLAKTEREGVRYVVLNKSPKQISSKEDLDESMVTEQTIELASKKKEIHILPSVEGNVTILVSLGMYSATAGALTLFGKIVVAIAVSFVVGAIMKALFKPPERKDPTTTKSYLLNGGENRRSQGVSVPVGYGRLKIGAVNIAQNKKTKRAKNTEHSSDNLESFTEIEFIDLLSEGPIEGFCNQNGGLLNYGGGLRNSPFGLSLIAKAINSIKGGISQGVFLDNVPISNTPISSDKEPTLNYILNEDGDLPEFQDGSENSSSVISKEASFVVDKNTVLYGAGPYSDQGEEPKEDGYRPTVKGAKENGALICSHFIANKNVSKVRIEFNSSLAVQNNDGSTSPNSVRFAILIERDYQEVNVLRGSNSNDYEAYVNSYSDLAASFLSSGGGRTKAKFGQDHWDTYGQEEGRVMPSIFGADTDSKCIVTFPNNSGNQLKRSEGGDHFILTGIATGVYAFDIQVQFSRAKITSKGVTFKIIKLSDEMDPSAKGGVGGIGKTRDIKVVSVCEIIEEDFLYPHSALVKLKFDSKNFSNIPERSYHVKLKKVLIPSNYDPVSRRYNGPWDGLFKGQSDSSSSVHSVSDQDKFWTDNPAWVFYDLLHNSRFGVGRYGLEEDHIDKWQLYKISKYCDELVETDYPPETSSSMPRSFSTLNQSSSSNQYECGTFEISIDSLQLANSSDSTESGYSSFINDFGDGISFSGKMVAFFISSSNINPSSLTGTERDSAITSLKRNSAKHSGEIIIAERMLIKSSPSSSGGGTLTLTGPSFDELSSSFSEGSSVRTIGACAVQVNYPIVEPRFTSNLYLQDKMEALKLINNIASVFRGIISYHSGKIIALQDSLKSPIQLFNNSNVARKGFSYSGSSKDQKITSSVVRFNDKEDNFRPSAVYEEDSSAVQEVGFKEKETLGFGITSSSQARRLAKWVLFTTQLEIETVSFLTGQEASYLFPGSIFEVSDENRVGQNKSGRVLDVQFYKKFIEIEEVGGVRVVKSEQEKYDPYILLDKNSFRNNFVSRVELTVSVGLSNSNQEKLELRAPFERSNLDQDAEISDLLTPQILKFDSTLEVDLSIDKKGPQGQNCIASDLFLKIPFQISLPNNTFSVTNHGFSDSDRISFVSEGSLPSGLDPNRRRSTAYYIIESTKHTFKISTSLSGLEVNVVNIGNDKLGNVGGLHYLIPSDPSFTKEALKQIMIGSAWSAKGTLSTKSDEQVNQQYVDNLDLEEVGDYLTKANWSKSSWLGWIWKDSGDWIYVYSLGWVYVRVFRESITDSLWFYLDPGSGWIWTNNDLKNEWWFFYNLSQGSSSASGWVAPLYFQGNIVEFHVHDLLPAGKNVGDDFYLGERKFVISSKNASGYFIRKAGQKHVGASHPDLSSPPASLDGQDLNQRRNDLVESGYFKKVNILSFEAKSKSESIQGKDAIQVNLSETHSVKIQDSQVVFIEDVVSSNNFDDNVNVVYFYDSVNKKWSTSIEPWVLLKISDYKFELLDSSDLFSRLDSLSISNFGEINFLPPVELETERHLEGQLFRTMSVKEGNSNQYEVVGLEYNQSKFDAIDKRTVVRKPILPIPPQADMQIPEPPDSLILTDLTR